MKKSRFYLGLLFGLIISIAIFFVASCKSESTVTEPIAPNPPSVKLVKQLNSGVDVYTLAIDNIQYIVVVNGRDGGVAITQHKLSTP
jgi:hypothetical protein